MPGQGDERDESAFRSRTRAGSDRHNRSRAYAKVSSTASSCGRRMTSMWTRCLPSARGSVHPCPPFLVTPSYRYWFRA
jgi:hypothetical protein